MDNFWEKMLALYGPMWVIIVAGGLFIIKLCYWCAPYVKSIVESHNNLVNALAQNESKQTKALEDTAKALEAIACLLDKHHMEVSATLAKIQKEIKCDTPPG